MSFDNWSIPSISAKSEASPGPAVKPVRLKLETSRDLAKALARLTRSALSGAIRTEDLSRYANAIGTIHRILIDGELAAITARLDTLEGVGK